MNEQPKLIARIRLTGSLFILFVAVYLILKVTQFSMPELLEHLLLVLVAMMGVHLLERAFLWKEVAAWNRSALEDVMKASNEIVASSAASGVANIYPSRENVKGEIFEEIKKARKRVWLLGVALSEVIHLNELLPHLIDNKKHGRDVKVLLLNALRSPAVFRTFLESHPRKAKEIIKAYETPKRRTNPYFNQRLYTDFDFAFNQLNLISDLKETVRFYAHSPNCWLIIIDNKAYFEPYTFGRGKFSQHGASCIGALMPIFKFEKNSTSNTFEIIEDHFRKLWLTSTTDLFHLDARREDKERILNEILSHRFSWLKHVANILYDENGKSTPVDKRKFPRQPCEQGPVNVTIEWGKKDQPQQTNGTIIDFSYEGVGIQLNNAGIPNQGEIVKVKPTIGSQTKAGTYVIDQLIKNRDFSVQRTYKKRDRQLIGLRIYNQLSHLD